MTDAMTIVDPELRPGLETPTFIPKGPELPAVREMHRQMIVASLEASPPDDIKIEELWVDTASGNSVRLLVYSNAARSTEARAGFLHMHGGGYILGIPEMSHQFCVSLVRDFDCIVASVDYRLAPDTPHPGPLEDCYAALGWLHGKASEYGVDTDRISIGGESAGGGLAAALALLARDRKEFPVHFQLMVYPMLDDRSAIGAEHPFAGTFVWTKEANHFGWQSLLGREPGSEPVLPYAAAGRADDLAGLPPTFIAVGALDLFVEENMEYARRLIRAGVPTELHVYPGAYHSFNVRVPDARVSRQCIADVNRALERALGSGDDLS